MAVHCPAPPKNDLPPVKVITPGWIVALPSGAHASAPGADHSAMTAARTRASDSFGFIETELTSGLPAELLERARQAAAIPRIGTPADVAPAIVFLASPEASYITGQVLGIDGGLTI